MTAALFQPLAISLFAGSIAILAVVAPLRGADPAPAAPPVAGDKVRTENGVTIAEGHAHFVYGLRSVNADTIRFDPAAHTAELTGNAEIREEIEGGVNLITGDRIRVTFGSGDVITVGGSHRTRLIRNKPQTPEEKHLDEVTAEGFFAYLKGEKLEKEGKSEEAIQQMELANRKFEELKTISAVPDEEMTILRQRIVESLQRLRGKHGPGTR